MRGVAFSFARAHHHKHRVKKKKRKKKNHEKKRKKEQKGTELFSGSLWAQSYLILPSGPPAGSGRKPRSRDDAAH